MNTVGENFSVEILESEVPKEKLDGFEIKYIDEYGTLEGEGYNCEPGGTGPSLKRIKAKKRIEQRVKEAKKYREEHEGTGEFEHDIFNF